ncbi:MAG: DUF2807 domain-containing protein [Muribaculaceae bacterium]|nr:DUF2807 domain-containing protein [Muribaculaceae bacterium]
MKRVTLYSLLLIAATSLSMEAENFTLDVGQFEKLKVNGNLTVIYKNLPDSTGLARYSAPIDQEGIIIFSTKGDGSLKIEPSDDKWGTRDLPVVYVYSDFLSSVESYSDRTVDIINVAPASSFNVSQVGNGTITIDNLKCTNLTAAINTGNGSIYLSGSCLNANYRMVGAGLISADRLSADNVKCRILGTGSIGCWPIDNLNVTGLGSTKIYYKGSPNIKKTGGGKLFELPSDMDESSYSRLGTPVESFNSPTVNSSPDEDYEDDDDYETVVTDEDD